MSMHRFAGSGPIMAGLAAMSEPNELFGAPVEVSSTAAPLSIVARGKGPHGGSIHGCPIETGYPASFAPSNEDIVRMIENVADQVAEMAAIWRNAVDEAGLTYSNLDVTKW